MTGKMISLLFSVKRLPGMNAFLFFFALPAWLFFTPSRTYAVQSHGGIEGLVSHQVGHLLFFTGMLFLLYRVKKGRLTSPGWQEFTTFLLFILLWNILTFVGHWMREDIGAEHFVRQGNRVIGFQVDTLSDLLFYLTRLDHLLLVPAIFMLLLAIRKWGQKQ